MTVDRAKNLDFYHLLRWYMAIFHPLDLAFGEPALFGDGVGSLLDSLFDSLTDGAVGFANPVAYAAQGRLDSTDYRHGIHLSD